MSSLIRFLLRLLFSLALLLALALAALKWWLSGDGLKRQVQESASLRLGIPVEVQRLSLDVWPLPAVAVYGLQIQTSPPIRAEQIAARPSWISLTQGHGVELLSLSVKGLQLPQSGIHQIQQSLAKKSAPTSSAPRALAASSKSLSPPASEAADATSGFKWVGVLAIPKRIQLQDVVWQSVAGETLRVSGQVLLNAQRDAAQVELNVAEGSISGPIELAGLHSRSGIKLSGELRARALSAAALPGVKARLNGRIDSTTRLDAQSAQLDGLGKALLTRTQLSVTDAVIKGVDLSKAVKTLGMSRDGETPLSELTANISTRGTGAPMQISVTELQASSKILKASGAVNIGAAAKEGAPRPLSGKLSVDLNSADSAGKAGKALDALVGIPLEISGTSAAPQVQPTRGALIGGTLGSLVAPVIGTGAGAKAGDKAAEKLSGFKQKLFGK